MMNLSSDPADLLDLRQGSYDILLSTANNELRVWDVSAFEQDWQGSAAASCEVEVPCLFCFRFAPNQGQLLTLAGTFDEVILGFQSTRLFRLHLRRGWEPLCRAKCRSHATKYFTFNVDQLRTEPREFAGKADCKADQTNRSHHEKREGHAEQVTFRSRFDSEPSHFGIKLPGDKASISSRRALALANSSCKFCCQSLLEQMPVGDCHIGFVHCLAMETRSGMVASGGGDGRIIFWKHRLPGISFSHGGAVRALVACEAGEIFSGDVHGRIRIWDCANVEHGSRAVLFRGGGSSAAVLCMATCGETRCFASALAVPLMLVVGDAAGVLRIWDPRGCVLLREVFSGMTCCAGLCTLGCSPFPLASASGGWAVRVACGGDTSGLVRIGSIVTFEDHHGDAENVTSLFSPKRMSVLQEEADFAHLLALLKEFVAISTVSSDIQYAKELERGATWLAHKFEELLACTVRVSDTGCVAARCGWDETKPLVVLYSHYDVVAAEAGPDWCGDPWQLTASDGYLHGRGVSDNKGPLLAQIFAVRRLLCGEGHSRRRSRSDLVSFCLEEKTDCSDGCPVNVLFLVDSREEAGDTAAVLQLLREVREDGWLRGEAAGLIVTNSSWIDDERPCICYGMRGVVDLEIHVTGGERCLHSGVHGGLVSEPMFDLMAICSSLVDSEGSPIVPGIMDSVRPISDEDMKNIEAAACGMSIQGLRQRIGLLPSHAGPRWLNCRQAPCQEALRRTWLHPAVSITEIGPGSKHQHGRHIANHASCVVSVRTTPAQQHEAVVGVLQRHLQHEFAKRKSPNVLEMRTLGASDWWVARTSSAVHRAALAAMAEAWQIPESEVLSVREGGTMAILPLLEAELKCDAAQMAFTQASDAVHLPNERMSIKVLQRAVDAVCGLLVRLGAKSSSVDSL